MVALYTPVPSPLDLPGNFLDVVITEKPGFSITHLKFARIMSKNPVF